MKITGGWIDCLLIGSGPYNFNDLQHHTWNILGGSGVIGNAIQTFDAVWHVSGSGSKEDDDYSYSWTRQATADATLQVWISTDNMVHLARFTNANSYDTIGTQTKKSTGIGNTAPYTEYEAALSSSLTQWSPNLTDPYFAHGYWIVTEFPFRGGLYWIKMPNRPVRDNVGTLTQLWTPGNSRYDGYWHWEIDFG